MSPVILFKDRGDLDNEDDVFSSNPRMVYMSKRTTWSDASVLDNNTSFKYLVYSLHSRI